MQTEKTEKTTMSLPKIDTSSETTEDQQITLFCKINLKLESYLYSLLAMILYLPVVGVVKFAKGAVWVVMHIPQIIMWIVEKLLLPVFTAIWKLIVFIGMGFVIAVQGIWALIKIIVNLLKRLFAWINWCAVRSLFRAISAIAGIGSFAYVINSFRFYTTDAVFTGYFRDANPEIQNIHIAMVILMLSITVYYNAWAFSKSEERKFVCKNTWGSRKLREALKNMWK